MFCEMEPSSRPLRFQASALKASAQSPPSVAALAASLAAARTLQDIADLESQANSCVEDLSHGCKT
jgi:hypothetical protein